MLAGIIGNGAYGYVVHLLDKKDNQIARLLEQVASLEAKIHKERTFIIGNWRRSQEHFW